MEIELGDSKHIGRWTMPQKGMLTTRFTAEMQQSVNEQSPKTWAIELCTTPENCFFAPTENNADRWTNPRSIPVRRYR